MEKSNSRVDDASALPKNPGGAHVHQDKPWCSAVFSMAPSERYALWSTFRSSLPSSASASAAVSIGDSAPIAAASHPALTNSLPVAIKSSARRCTFSGDITSTVVVADGSAAAASSGSVTIGPSKSTGMRDSIPSTATPSLIFVNASASVAFDACVRAIFSALARTASSIRSSRHG